MNNTKKTITLQYDPHNHSAEQIDLMKEALEKKFNVEEQELLRASILPPTHVTIVLEPITTLVLTVGAIVVKKWVELFAQDLYQCAKEFIKGFSKPQAGDIPTLGFECKIDEIVIRGYIQTNDEALLDYIFSKGIEDLLSLGFELIKSRKLISDVPLLDMFGGEPLKPNDKLPESVKEIQFSFHFDSKNWKIQHISTEGMKMYMVKRDGRVNQ